MTGMDDPHSCHATIETIWCQILEINADGQQSFYSLGGDSLKALRLLSDVTEQLAVTVDIAWFLQNPTLAALQEHVASAIAASQL
jgi:acyl carrier protein